MKSIEQKNAEAVTAFIEDTANRRLLEETEQFFVSQFLKAFTDRHYAIDEILAQGDKAIARIFITAVHTGPFAGHPSTGKAVKATQFREFHVIDGKIAGHRGWYDTATLLPQIQAQ